MINTGEADGYINSQHDMCAMAGDGDNTVLVYNALFFAI